MILTKYSLFHPCLSYRNYWG